MKELIKLISSIEDLKNVFEGKNTPRESPSMQEHVMGTYTNNATDLEDILNKSDDASDSSINTKPEEGIEFKCLADGLTFKEATTYVLARTKIYNVMITTPLLFEYMLGIIYPMFKSTKEVLFPLERNHLLLGLKSKTLIPSKLDIASLEGNDYCVLDITKFLLTLNKEK